MNKKMAVRMATKIEVGNEYPTKRLLTHVTENKILNEFMKILEKNKCTLQHFEEIAEMVQIEYKNNAMLDSSSSATETTKLCSKRKGHQNEDS